MDSAVRQEIERYPNSTVAATYLLANDDWLALTPLLGLATVARRTSVLA